MEMETLFSEQKWNIIRCLSEGRYSPLQLAGKLNTSIANISQQLRLLEAANLVKTERIPSRDKGMPRKLFSLSNNYVYLIPAMKDFADKRLLEISDHHESILRIWFLDNPKLHYDMEKFYWKIEPYLDQIKVLAICQKEEPTIIVVSSNPKEIEKNLVTSIKELKAKQINVILLKEDEAIRMMGQKKGSFSNIDGIHIIHDPNNIISSHQHKKLIGG